ncbi:branched-chain amino acid ABC transporter permease [Pseudoclavibacter sp. CFCC 14310]|uniref:AzlC family ABC transporter permease n=1 Tax=Pseudoclavibacter sp. CFCC 14310 TaxID=2615180 RepID=UPI001300EAFF|nr:AzlC family ABC transporter permease [Pseudoclavibacter sp. CFCC 14310]KAB1647209.1 branched-chain amino acid ABC transporter permease [Pseudoclavibacter sp. CFCC 14310]
MPEHDPLTDERPSRSGADDRREAWRMGLSVSIATALYGISFGALSVAAGFTTVQSLVMSLLLFTGGSQYAIVGVVTTGGFTPASAVSAVASSSLLAMRHSLYGLQLAPILDLPGLRRLAAAQFTIDETAAVALAQPTRAAKRLGFWVTAVGVYLGWAAMTLVGALIGEQIPDPRVWGLDAAAAAAFLGLLWPRLRGREPIAIAIAAAVVALVLTPTTPAGIPVLVAAAVGLAIASIGEARRVNPRRRPRDRQTDRGMTR